jgi:hypothetical protein
MRTQPSLSRFAAVAATLTIGACFNPQLQEGAACAEGDLCPPGQSCIDGFCFDDSNVPECASDGFVDCVENLLRTCESSALATTDCGAAGCNDAAQRCNECVPDTISCDGGSLVTCDADGLIAAEEACAAGCVNSVTQGDHCAYLSPKFLPDVCDELAAEATFVVSNSGTFDTDLDTNCNGGIVVQADGPEICVLRYGTFVIEPDVTLDVGGSRAFVVVTDGALEIHGTLDVAATEGASGPGGGTIRSGAGANQTTGGGGAGFRVTGGDGGSTVNGGGSAGGAALDPIGLASLIGGPRPNSSTNGGFIGGGGGTTSLISCRETVSVASTGTIDAGGGGGSHKNNLLGCSGGDPTFTGGGGGGAGGQVVLQGISVAIEGSLFANGGGGGAGGDKCDGNDGIGVDGTTSAVTPAAGGTALSGSGAGGDGGLGAVSPSDGLARTTGAPGGGGGSPGFLRVAVPSGIAATLDPVATSPPLSLIETAATR